MNASRSSRARIAPIVAVWLAIALVAGTYCVWRFLGPTPLQTNLLALLPPTEADPVADLAADRLANALGDRAVLLVTDADAARATDAAKQLATLLADSHAFHSVTAELPPFDPSQIGRFYLRWRFGLLSDDDRADLRNASMPLHGMLMRELYGFPQAGLGAPPGADPFGWLSHWLAGLPLATSHLTLDRGMLVAHHDGVTSVLVTAALQGSAYDSRVQQITASAVSAAGATLKSRFPGISIARTGTVFYAEAARSAAERESHRIGIVSLGGIALLMLWVFRSPRLLLLSFVSTALGIVCALAVTLLAFGQLHLLTLVFGASLIGEAVDYSIQYFIVRQGSGNDWDPRRGARIVRPALSVALATSLIGYLVLACVPFPVLRQIACFAVVGIAVAYSSVLGLLPALMPTTPARGDRRMFARAARILRPWHRAVSGRRGVVVCAVLVLAAIPGWLQLKSNDDVHLLIQTPRSLVADEQAISRATGIESSTQFFVVKADTPERVLELSEMLTDRLATMPAALRPASWQAVTEFVPSAQRQHDDRDLIANRVFADAGALRSALGSAGFRDTVIDDWIAAWSHSGADVLTVDAWLAQTWAQPFRHLWMGRVHDDPPAWAAMIVPYGVTAANEDALRALARDVPGASFVDKAASASRLLGAYRADSALWLGATSIIVCVLLMIRYRPRAGIAVAMPVLLAISSVVAFFGYLHLPFTLFNCLALVLVLGVGANYAVFLREGALRSEAELGAVWTGVLLSSATTLLSFGMLGMSDMPALRNFGLTLTVGIVVAVLLAPLGIPRAQGERQ